MDDPSRAPRVELQFFDGCATWREVERRLRALGAELGFEVELRRVADPAQAEALGFRGSPTILLDGRDVFASDDLPVGLSCRLYATPAGRMGAPTMDQLRRAFGPVLRQGVATSGGRGSP